jgi:uncharacterized protein (DUF697 family)
MIDVKEEIKKLFEEAKRDYQSFGGWSSFKSGDWLWDLIQRSFAAYWKNANVEYFQKKYQTNDTTKIAGKLISITAKNAAILGAFAGATVSVDEIAAIVTGGEGGIGLPANITIAAAAIGGEAILMMRLQLQLLANLGKLYGVPLDPEDPEDILTILAFALGGSAAEMAGKFGMKIGGRLAGRAAKDVFKKETLVSLKHIAAKVGIKILQKSIVKYTIPIASVGIGTGWNYMTTKSVAKIATKHFKLRLNEMSFPIS